MNYNSVYGLNNMAEIKDCLGFETFEEDVQKKQEARGMPCRELAEEIDISIHYLANIELGQTIPSIPVVM